MVRCINYGKKFVDINWNLKFEYVEVHVYENSSHEFDRGHCMTTVKVTAELQISFLLTQ